LSWAVPITVCCRSWPGGGQESARDLRVSGRVRAPGDAPARHKPPTDAAAVREIETALTHVRHRAEEIRQAPQEHKPRLVVSDQVPGNSFLTILNLPTLSIMISLQVSANRAQTASDRRAIADHETLIALPAMATQQIDILHGQDKVLAILDNFASKDMPGRQRQIQDAVGKILAAVAGPAPA
jgi:hypothetical protein